MWGIVRQKMPAGLSPAMRKRPVGSATRGYWCSAKQMTVREALNSALDEEMSANPKFFLMGEKGKWLFTGGWDKTVSVQELMVNEFQVDAIPIGSIPFGSVITTLFYWQGKLFVGYADRTIKVIDHIINSAAKSNYMSAGQKRAYWYCCWSWCSTLSSLNVMQRGMPLALG